MTMIALRTFDHTVVSRKAPRDNAGLVKLDANLGAQQVGRTRNATLTYGAQTMGEGSKEQCSIHINNVGQRM